MSTSILRRLWRRIVNPTYLVGRDLEGNRYYEYPNANAVSDFGRTKRVVKYRRGYDMWTYIAGGKRLPIQWTSWLTHTRPYPPTLEELHADIERQRRVLFNAAVIEAREREANARAQITAAPSHPSMDVPVDNVSASMPPQLSPNAQKSETRPDAIPSTPVSRSETLPPKEKHSPFSSTPASDEPQSWTPRAIRRGD